MRTLPTVAGLSLVLTFASGAFAQTPADAAPSNQARQAAPALVLPKDPLVAMYFSATVPGLGQAYAGHKMRGALFFASVVASFGAAYASYEPAQLHLSDYDRATFGGNGDGVLSVQEAKNWEDRKFQDTAFDRLSTERKVGLVTGAAAGAALYIWNIFDARARAHEHNRELAERRISVGIQAAPTSASVALGFTF